MIKKVFFMYVLGTFFLGLNAMENQDNQDKSLYMALVEQDFDTAHKILAEGSFTPHFTTSGVTELMVAIKVNEKLACQIILIQAQLQNSAYLNKKDNNGYTALHLAVLHSQFGVVLALVNAGVDINVESNDKKTPFDLALQIKCANPEQAQKNKAIQECLAFCNPVFSCRDIHNKSFNCFINKTVDKESNLRSKKAFTAQLEKTEEQKDSMEIDQEGDTSVVLDAKKSNQSPSLCALALFELLTNPRCTFKISDIPNIHMALTTTKFYREMLLPFITDSILPVELDGQILGVTQDNNFLYYIQRLKDENPLTDILYVNDDYFNKHRTLSQQTKNNWKYKKSVVQFIGSSDDYISYSPKKIKITTSNDGKRQIPLNLNADETIIKVLISKNSYCVFIVTNYSTYLYSPETNELEVLLENEEGEIDNAYINDDGTLIAVERGFGFDVINRENGENSVIEHNEAPTSIAFSPDKSCIASSCDDEARIVITYLNGNNDTEIPLPDTVEVRSLAFTPDNAHLIAVTANKIFIIDAKSSAIKATFNSDQKSTEDVIRSGVCFNANGSTAAIYNGTYIHIIKFPLLTCDTLITQERINDIKFFAHDTKIAMLSDNYLMLAHVSQVEKIGDRYFKGKIRVFYHNAEQNTYRVFCEDKHRGKIMIYDDEISLRQDQEFSLARLYIAKQLRETAKFNHFFTIACKMELAKKNSQQ